ARRGDGEVPPETGRAGHRLGTHGGGRGRLRLRGPAPQRLDLGPGHGRSGRRPGRAVGRRPADLRHPHVGPGRGRVARRLAGLGLPADSRVRPPEPAHHPVAGPGGGASSESPEGAPRAGAGRRHQDLQRGRHHAGRRSGQCAGHAEGGRAGHRLVEGRSQEVLRQRVCEEGQAMTYSIVARDPDTGELGVAVQSMYFQVGPVVPWAEAGVGAVATQSVVNVAFGPLGLELMRGGLSAEQALAAVLAGDAEPEGRQCAMVDAAGRVAAYTGPRATAAAGHRTGDGYSCQANLMERDTVWDAMAAAYENAAGRPLAERLIEALRAAEGEGGDIRGRQSAALLLVSGRPTGRLWEDRLMDLRVEDHEDPVEELARLVRLRTAYLALRVFPDDPDFRERTLAALRLAPEQAQVRISAGMMH